MQRGLWIEQQRMSRLLTKSLEPGWGGVAAKKRESVPDDATCAKS